MKKFILSSFLTLITLLSFASHPCNDSTFKCERPHHAWEINPIWNGFVLGNISLGYNSMSDTKYVQWLNESGLQSHVTFYPSCIINMMAGFSKHIFGFDMEFYGSPLNNYPIRVNCGLEWGSYKTYKQCTVLWTYILGTSALNVNNFTNPIPNEPTGQSDILTDNCFYFSLNAKLLLNSPRSTLCTGLDMGVRYYFGYTGWAMENNSSNSSSNNQAISVNGIPSPATFDFYVNILIGGLGNDQARRARRLNTHPYWESRLQQEVED